VEPAELHGFAEIREAFPVFQLPRDPPQRNSNCENKVTTVGKLKYRMLFTDDICLHLNELLFIFT